MKTYSVSDETVISLKNTCTKREIQFSEDLDFTLLALLQAIEKEENDAKKCCKVLAGIHRDFGKSVERVLDEILHHLFLARTGIISLEMEEESDDRIVLAAFLTQHIESFENDIKEFYKEVEESQSYGKHFRSSIGE